MSSLLAQYFLNHRLDTDELRWQTQALALAGYHGLYAHARQGLLTPYMSEDWWRAIDTIMEVCGAYGLEFWIWDEDYYPSGLAGGRVVWEDPGLVARGLDFTVVDLAGAGPFEADFAPGALLRAFAIPRCDGTYGEPLDVTCYCGTRRQRWTARYQKHTAYSPQIDALGHPHWRTSMTDNRFALTWTPPQAGEWTIVGVTVANAAGVHPDMLRPEAVRRFIELSYEPYYERYAGRFGTLLQGAFTDEPSPGGFLYPWTARFPEEFRSDHGYDLLPYLVHLTLDINESSAIVRHHYRLTQHRLQRSNYVEQIAAWCERHGIKMAGHLTRTEWLSLVASWWPNELRCYSPMHVPCADPLGATAGWSSAAAYHTGLKVASSAAHLFGREQAGSDAVAVIGDEASLRDLKYHFDYQMALGINHFTVHGLSYSTDGPRKDEVPPSIFYQHTQWKHMPVLLDYVARTCEALTGGEHLCETALLYPSTSLACQMLPGEDWRNLPDEAAIHALVERLLSHQRDFDFIDEVTLQEAVNEAGEISTPEPYRIIVLPYLRYVDVRTAAALLRFAGRGGLVLAVGSLPLAIGPHPTEVPRHWADSRVKLCETLDETVLRDLPGVNVWGTGARDVFVLRRRKEGEILTFAFNRREEEFQGRIDGRVVSIPPRGGILLRDDGAQKKDSSRSLLRLAATTIASWHDDWTVEFEPNQLPLNFWHLSDAAPDKPEVAFAAPGFDLMRREIDPAGEGEDTVRYHCRFLLTGEISGARLVMEDSTVGGDWRVFVNGRQVTGWTRAVLFDCRNIQAEVSQALRGGSTPQLNVITIETRGPGRGLKEVPYLYGSFTCEYRYGHLSYPFIRGASSVMPLASLLPWASIGYPTFSGSAVYRRLVPIPQRGDLVLDLGRVAEVAVVRVDRQEIATLAWPPYRCSLTGILPGEHELAIEVTNAPANRNRVAGLPSGLLGPVRLLAEHRP